MRDHVSCFCYIFSCFFFFPVRAKPSFWRGISLLSRARSPKSIFAVCRKLHFSRDVARYSLTYAAPSMATEGALELSRIGDAFLQCVACTLVLFQNDASQAEQLSQNKAPCEILSVQHRESAKKWRETCRELLSMESQFVKPSLLNGRLKNSKIGGCKEIRQPFANPVPTLCQPFANLFCQPLSNPPFPSTPGARLETRVNGMLDSGQHQEIDSFLCPIAMLSRRKPKGDGGKGTGNKCHDNSRQTSRQFTTWTRQLATFYDNFRLFAPLT